MDLADSALKKKELFRGVAEQKNIDINVKAEKNILIRIDPLAIDRILNNLLINSVKYIGLGGQITIEVQRKDGKAILWISDNRPGLSVETFEQGIGVGLSIVKKKVDGLGAGITVEKADRKGVSFTISFTEACPDRPGEALHSIPDTAPSHLVNGVIKERNISAEKPALLTIDNNVQLWQFMQSSLENKYSVFLARDVFEALLKLKIIHRP